MNIKIKSALIAVFLLLPHMHLYISAEPWRVSKNKPRHKLYQDGERLSVRGNLNTIFANYDSISYCVAAEEKLSPYYEEYKVDYPFVQLKDTTAISRDELKAQFIVAFNEWTKGAAYMLEQHPRAAEFQDMIKLLRKDFKLNYVGECDIKGIKRETPPLTELPAIKVIYSPTYCKTKSLASADEFSFSICMRAYEKNTSRPSFGNTHYAQAIEDVLSGKIEKYPYPLTCAFHNNETNEDIHYFCDQTLRILIHELGHLFGLADQYHSYADAPIVFRGITKGFIFYTGTEFIDIYSIMGMGSRLNYGDVEGLLYLLSEALGQEITIDPVISSDYGSKIIKGHYKASKKEKKEAAKIRNEIIKDGAHGLIMESIKLDSLKKDYPVLFK